MAYDAVQGHLANYIRKNITYLLPGKSLAFPFGGVDGLYEKYLKWRSSDLDKFFKCGDAMNRYSRKIIEEREAQIAKEEREAQIEKEENGGKDNKADEEVEADDLLSFFMHAVGNDMLPNLQTGKDAKFQYLSDIVLSFVLAGRDTTAAALSWTLFELSRKPEIQRKLQEELDEALPDKADPTFDDVYGAKMPYLNGVLYEALRLYPPLPSDSKTAMVDDVLPDGTPIMKGTRLVFFIYGMGRDPKIWGDDVLEFKPERWIPFKIPTGGIWPVFQLGPRRCIGENMAIMEAKIVLVMLMHRFKLTLLPGEEAKICPSNNFLMTPCNSLTHETSNLWLQVKDR